MSWRDKCREKGSGVKRVKEREEKDGSEINKTTKPSPPQQRYGEYGELALYLQQMEEEAKGRATRTPLTDSLVFHMS